MITKVLEGQLRHVLTLVGALLTEKGWATDAEVEIYVGIALVVISFGLSAWDKFGKKAPKVPPSAGLFILALVCCFSLPSCADLAGTLTYRTESGAKAGLVVDEEGSVTPFFRLPLFNLLNEE